MSRPYTTIDEQNTYDLVVQLFGTVNELSKVLRQVPDLNTDTPYGVDMVFEDTTNNLAERFTNTGVRFATGDDSEIAPLFDIFDDTFDDTFN